MSNDIAKPLAAPRKPQPPCSDNRVPGQIMEKIATGSEFFDQYPPTGEKDVVLEVIRALQQSLGLLFQQSEVAHERFKAPDGHQYARYVFDITMSTRGGFRWCLKMRHSVEVPFRGEGTSYRAKKLAMRDFISLQFGVELPFEPEAATRRGLPTGPIYSGSVSAAHKKQMFEDIERITTTAELQQYVEQSKKHIEWLWRRDRPLIAAAMEQRAIELSKPGHKTTAAAQRPQKASEGVT